ncbi:MAG: cytochrome c oxidase cbb3-type subunit, partial [Campylobacterota bacterium]|nr:cytochrome c oxidase cbb3-type subunit [Campylobacterota bacterium]
PYLVISIWAFLFVMIQGNILFIPEIRWPFHRNDLIIAHAHVAIGLGIFFMSLSIIKYFYKLPDKLMHFWLLVMGLIFVSLSLAGFDEAAIFAVDVVSMWQIRLIAGIVAVFGLGYFIVKKMKIAVLSKLQLYHLNGFLSDGLGALILFLSAPLLFEFLGFLFTPHYYLIFGFMGFVGILHLIGVVKEAHFLAYLTSIARLITGSVFLSLFYLGTIDALGLLVGLYDISYALLYLVFRSRL